LHGSELVTGPEHLKHQRALRARCRLPASTATIAAQPGIVCTRALCRPRGQGALVLGVHVHLCAFARDSGGAQPPAARAARRACSGARDRYETGAPASDCASRYSIHARTASGLAERRRPTRNVFKWPAAMAAWITGGDSPVTF